MGNRIKILEVIGSMDMGGAETFLMNVLRNINSQKFELFFLVYGKKHFDYEDELKRLGGHIIRIDNPKKIFDFVLAKKIEAIIKNNRIDIVHAHTYYNSMYAVLAAKNAKINKIIVHSHNTKPESTNNPLKKLYYKISKIIINRYATTFLACGKEAGEALFNKNKHFSIIENGIIVSDFVYSKDNRNKKRNELGLPNKTVALVHIGRFDIQKNHEFLIDVFYRFQEVNPSSILFLIGDGKLKDSILKKVHDIGIDKKVVFLGKRSDVNELLSAMDVLVFPSLYEGMPVTLIEAQVNGIPIIASSNIDKDINFTGSISFVSIDDSTKKWADTVKKRMTEGHGIYGLDAYKKYDISNCVKKIEGMYETA